MHDGTDATSTPVDLVAFDFPRKGGGFGGSPGGGGGGYMAGGAVDSPAGGSGGPKNKDKQSILAVNIKQVTCSRCGVSVYYRLT